MTLHGEGACFFVLYDITVLFFLLLHDLKKLAVKPISTESNSAVDQIAKE